MLPKFLPFEGKYVSVRAVWRNNAPQEATRATVFSSRPHTMRDVVIPLLVPLEAATEPLQTGWGNLHNLIGGSQRHHKTSPQWTMAPRGPQPSRVLKHPRVTRSARDRWGNQKSLGGSVDQGLLNHSRANQQV